MQCFQCGFLLFFFFVQEYCYRVLFIFFSFLFFFTENWCPCCFIVTNVHIFLSRWCPYCFWVTDVVQIVFVSLMHVLFVFPRSQVTGFRATYIFAACGFDDSSDVTGNNQTTSTNAPAVTCLGLPLSSVLSAEVLLLMWNFVITLCSLLMKLTNETICQARRVWQPFCQNTGLTWQG